MASDAQGLDAPDSEGITLEIELSEEAYDGVHGQALMANLSDEAIASALVEYGLKYIATTPPATLSPTLSANRHAYDHVPTVDEYTRNILNSMVDDWLNRYEPGAMEWSDAQVIRAWLDNYSGTFYADNATPTLSAQSVATIRQALKSMESKIEYGHVFGHHRNDYWFARIDAARAELDAHRTSAQGEG